MQPALAGAPGYCNYHDDLLLQAGTAGADGRQQLWLGDVVMKSRQAVAIAIIRVDEEKDDDKDKDFQINTLRPGRPCGIRRRRNTRRFRRRT